MGLSKDRSTRDSDANVLDRLLDTRAWYHGRNLPTAFRGLDVP